MNKKTEPETENTIVRFLEELSEPFPIELHSYKPLSLSKQGDGAWIAYYIDLRHMMKRFQELAHRYGFIYIFSCELVSYNDLGAVVKASLHLNTRDGMVLSYDDIGFAPLSAPEPPKSAATDAYRRVLSQLGLGRYLYHLPKVYISGDFSGYAKYDFNPLDVLRDAMNTDAETVIRSKRQNRQERQKQEPNENQRDWLETFGVEAVEELVELLKEEYSLSSSDKQIATYTRLVKPSDKELSDALIKSKLDEVLGNKR